MDENALAAIVADILFCQRNEAKKIKAESGNQLLKQLRNLSIHKLQKPLVIFSKRIFYI